MANELTTRGAASLLDNIATAINRLNVHGRENCYIVVACLNDIDRLREYVRLHDALEKAEKPETEGPRQDEQAKG